MPDFVSKFLYPLYLEGRDKIFVTLIEEMGPIVTFQEICDAFETAQLSRASAVATMQFSPLVQKVGPGLYKLIGRNSSPIDYITAEKRKQRASTNTEYGYTMEGEIIFKINIGSMGLGGVIPVYGLPNIAGVWKCYVSGNYLADISVNDSFIWRLSSIFKKLGINLKDRIEFRFNVWNKSVSVTKIEGNNNG